MTTKFIEDIRKIAKTDEILKKIPKITPETDKASIRGGRGVAYADSTVFNPCQLLYTGTDGSFTFAEIIDQAAGTPRIQDGDYNKCATLNTISGMRETGTMSPELHIVLKPDGMFLDNNVDSWYITSLLIPRVVFSAPGVYFPNMPWADPFYNWAYGSIASLTSALDAAFSDATYTLYSALYPGASAFENLGTTTYDDASLAAFLADEVTTGIEALVKPSIYSNGDITILHATYASGDIYVPVIRLPKTFAFTNTSATPAAAVLFPTDTAIPPAQINYSSYASFDSLSTLPSSSQIIQLAIELGASNLWKPAPGDTIAPLKYRNGVSILSFDFGASFSRKGVVRPGKDGGMVLYETSAGTPINNAFVYRRDRTLAAIVPVAQLDAYIA